MSEELKQDPFAGMGMIDFANISLDDVTEYRQLVMYRGTYALTQKADTSGIVELEDTKVQPPEKYLAIKLSFNIDAVDSLIDDAGQPLSGEQVVGREHNEFFRVRGEGAEIALGRFKAHMIDRGVDIAGKSIQDAIMAGNGQGFLMEMGMRRDRNDSSVVYRNAIKVAPLPTE